MNEQSEYTPPLRIVNDYIYLYDRKTNFRIQELIPKREYDLYKAVPANFLRFVTVSGITWLQFTRDFFGAPMYINNWHIDGHLSLRGYRPPEAGYFNNIRKIHGQNGVDKMISAFETAGISISEQVMGTGSYYSIHKISGAYDFTVEGQTADQTRKEILDNQLDFLNAGLTTLEDEKFAPSWVHGDNRPTGLDYILIVKPAA